MIIAMGSDKKTKTTDAIVDYLKSKGHQVRLFGGLIKPNKNWVKIAKEVALSVRNKEADEGILFCWTGTGVAMVASKIPGIRAATVSNEKTARDARAWDHANILSLSCFLPEKRALKIVNTWLKTPFSSDLGDLSAQKQIKQLEGEFFK